MTVTQKDWGTSEELFHSESFSFHKCFAKAGWACSKHYHAQRANLFQVNKGLLLVEEWEGHDVHGTLIPAGGCIVVQPEVVHRFTALEDTDFVEAYYPVQPSDIVLRTDIVRLENGGYSASSDATLAPAATEAAGPQETPPAAPPAV